MDDVNILKRKGLELFQASEWLESARIFEKCINIMKFDQQALACLGICYLHIGEHGRALSFFERLQAPLPDHILLNWSAILVHQRKYREALLVLSKDNGKFNKISYEEKLDQIANIVFEDIVALVSGAREVVTSKILRFSNRNRLLKITYCCIIPLLKAFGILGDIADKLGSSNGKKIRDLMDNFHGQCWVYGLSMIPRFFAGQLHLKNMRGYERVKDVYQKVFLSYLDYWIYSQENIRDFVLASQKSLDAHALYCIIREKQPKTILEIGTFIGFSTAIMAQALKDIGEGTIHSIDPNIAHHSTRIPSIHARKMLENLGLDGYVHMHEGFFSEPRKGNESSIPVLGKVASDFLPPINLAFIDGDHETAAVLQDFMLSLPLLSPNATIIFHDTKNWTSVRQAIFILFQDSFWKDQMRYFEFVPSGIDGLGMITFNDKGVNS
ncbi:MAG: class I SAM-dependent methyltransferase [Promethearchaeota archaeon]|jgi:predicted O-methyltransferase YrrM